MPTENGTVPGGNEYKPPLTPPDPNPGEYFYNAMQPNQMTYYDGDGKEHKICVKGRNEEATKLFVAKDWEGLKERFPEWTGSPEQHFQPEDYEKVPKDRARM